MQWFASKLAAIHNWEAFAVGGGKSSVNKTACLVAGWLRVPSRQVTRLSGKSLRILCSTASWSTLSFAAVLDGTGNGSKLPKCC